MVGVAGVEGARLEYTEVGRSWPAELRVGVGRLSMVVGVTGDVGIWSFFLNNLLNNFLVPISLGVAGTLSSPAPPTDVSRE